MSKTTLSSTKSKMMLLLLKSITINKYSLKNNKDQNNRLKSSLIHQMSSSMQISKIMKTASYRVPYATNS